MVAMSQHPLDFELRTSARHFPIRVVPASRLSDDELFELCARNKDLRIERTHEGELVVMSPTGGETSRRNAALVAALVVWALKNGSGVVFDSNGGFVLPNGAERAPDASWVRNARWDAKAEYVVNRARLGWLLDPETRRVWVYEPAGATTCLEDPATVSGGFVLPELVLTLASIW
jgi:Uma2 family endonuclease